MTIEQRAIELRAQGHTYREIAAALGIHHGKAWALCNPERNRANARESVARYRARGRIALCDMAPDNGHS